jgi:hypothetical protein
VAQSAGVEVALSPTAQSVAPGATFDLEIACTRAGAAFNGFEFVVSYDPAALTIVPLAPLSQQEGSLMKGACANTFHLFNAAEDSLAVTDVLMCAGASVTGPGQVYTLRFLAAASPQVTWVRFRSLQFFNSGVFVGPAYASDAVIGIGIQAGLPARPGASVPRITGSPNPMRGRCTLAVDAPGSGQQVRILDTAGRVVRHLGTVIAGSGTRRVAWDGRDDAGAEAPPGIYVAVLNAGRAIAHTRLVRIR